MFSSLLRKLSKLKLHDNNLNPPTDAAHALARLLIVGGAHTTTVVTRSVTTSPNLISVQLLTTEFLTSPLVSLIVWKYPAVIFPNPSM